MQTKRTAPVLLATALLILLIAYVGSYLVLVLPEGRTAWVTGTGMKADIALLHYRVDGQWPRAVYLPLEQLDRTARPASWTNNGSIGLDFSPPVQQMMPLQIDRPWESDEEH
ncbi:hypothetical protein NA78x_004549 [Anatilimnocola sp. NA78]|uniref:hypothetical protein n=1 Tax=Anatilimnocola sp. NA78 TaxID=3415683 RepID=UPI003CE4C692